MGVKKISLIKILLASTFVLSPSVAISADDANVAPEELSLEELMNTQIYSASKRPEKLSEAAASVYVITSEDIKKSGVTSIPEALRMVPGVNVAQSNANTWAISIRGFNQQFSNKLLVLIDGRSVYTPLFSGVWWDSQDYVLEDIDRIEVIKGPGGTLWGANAVNGVINIITKEARKTQGNYASVTGGYNGYASTEFRNGGKTGDENSDNYYRVYGKFVNNEDLPNSLTNADNRDNWQKAQSGFRYDFRDGSFNKMTLQADAYSGKKDVGFNIPTGAPPFSTPVNETTTFSGANVMLKWNSAGEKFNTDIKSYIDYAARDDLPLLKQEILTYDLDAQTQYNWGRHSFIGGGELRYIMDDLKDSATVGYSSDDTTAAIYSTFLQDKIGLVPDKLFLTLGTKVSYSEYTNLEVQPNARLSYTIDESNSVWASISQAVRTPTRGENGFSGLVPPGAPNFVNIIGNESYKSEQLTAYEVGYRGDLSKDLFFDVSAFYNDYDRLRTGQANGGTPPIILTTTNDGFGETYGLETYAVWGATDRLDIKPSYTFLVQNFHLNTGSNDTELEQSEEKSPQHQFSIGSYYRITKDINWDTNMYYVSNIHYYTTPGGVTTRNKIDAYTRLDTQVRWNVMKDVELSLIGQNLLDENHQEFDNSLYSDPSVISRTVYAKVAVKF